MKTAKCRVELERKAHRELSDLPKEITKQLAQVIDDLGSDPRPPGAKKLTAHEGYRIRKGAYRILYTINDSEHLIRIFRIGHRREVYR